MKTLIIARHGKAGEIKDNQPDMLRELAPRGHKDAKNIAKALLKKDIIPGLILSSPAVRSIETARDLAENTIRHITARASSIKQIAQRNACFWPQCRKAHC